MAWLEISVNRTRNFIFVLQDFQNRLFLLGTTTPTIIIENQQTEHEYFPFFYHLSGRRCRNY